MEKTFVLFRQEQILSDEIPLLIFCSVDVKPLFCPSTSNHRPGHVYSGPHFRLHQSEGKSVSTNKTTDLHVPK